MATKNVLSDHADSRSVESLYRQFTSIVNTREPIPPEVSGALAQSMGRTLAYYEKRETDFSTDVSALWSEIEGDRLRGSDLDKFLALYHDERLNYYTEYRPTKREQRRRPTPFETTVETCRRLVVVNQLRTVLQPHSSAILGGSLSYGRFYNVCGNVDGASSDIDLLLVLPNYSHLNNLIPALRVVEGVEPDSLSSLEERIRIFDKFRVRELHCILSHKLRFWQTGHDRMLKTESLKSAYNLSLHVMSIEDFRFVTLADMHIITGVDFERVLLDYRDTLPGRSYAQRSFSGIPLGRHSLDPEAVEGGYLAQVQVCLIREDRYCPGLHQNLILPQFERRWDGVALSLEFEVYRFRWKILERLRMERTTRPFEEQRLSFSHVRFDVFAPHITRRANRPEP